MGEGNAVGEGEGGAAARIGVSREAVVQVEGGVAGVDVGLDGDEVGTFVGVGLTLQAEVELAVTIGGGVA